MEYLLRLRSTIIHELDDEGYFLSKFISAPQETGLDLQQFRAALNYLIDNNLIKCSAYGTPDQIPIIKFKIEDENYLKLFRLKHRQIKTNNRFSYINAKLFYLSLFHIYNIASKYFKVLNIHVLLGDFYNKNRVIKLIKSSIPTFRITQEKVSILNKPKIKSFVLDYILEDKCIDIHKICFKRKRGRPFSKNIEPGVIERFPNVYTTVDEHHLLVAKYGENAVAKGYKYLSVYYKTIIPTARQLRSYHALDAWAIKAGINAY
ncbi:hypothetical protein UFOVP844_14 [uncultured Caudovirales phage]|uniref:Uncharacterized protein n=1 Tax=uncultured Caudovirales phage TaxID=2100421 RepID=A0A6J5PEW2_9CAUD|nr:hypothetical protein UFOVP844_14 [uncultured Caudovirales phage]